MFCNRHQELAFFYVKTKNVNVSPDNISAVGQYVCLDNLECNRSITDTAKLERFILSVRK